MKDETAFTLIELLVVVTLLGILAGIILVILKPDNLFSQARDSQRKNDLRQIQNSLEAYKREKGNYPISCSGCGNFGWINSIGGGSWIPGLDSTYIKNMPKDPKNSGCNSSTQEMRTNPPCYAYFYYSYSTLGAGCDISGYDYILMATLEGDKTTGASQKSVSAPGNNNCYTWSEFPAAGVYTLTAP